MAENKNQHYVPVFLLKNFDNNDRKTTNLFVIASKKFIQKVSIKDQASEDYFYGSDKVVEKLLGDLETIFSYMVNTIVSQNILPSRGSFEHFLLNLFVVSSSARTRLSGEIVDEQIDKMMKAVYKHDPKFEGKLDDVKIGIKNPASFSLSIAMQNVKYIADLEYKLIKNKTSQEFIISDNPVVKNNSFLRSRKWFGSQVGMAAKGIQYFFPLSPKYSIILYDQNCYRVGNKKDKVILLEKEQDVDSINAMQALNANEVLYFSKNVKLSDIESVTIQIDKQPKKEKVKIREYIEAGSTREKGSSLIVASTQHFDYGLNLSFIRDTKKSKKAILDNRAVQIRSSKIAEMIKSERQEDTNS